MKYSVKFLLSFLLLSCTLYKAEASHVFGGSLRYAYVNDTTYKVILEMYYECGRSLFPLADSFAPYIHPFVYIKDTSSNSFIDSIHLDYDSIAAVTKIVRPCMTEETSCTDPHSMITGVETCVFSKNYTIKNKVPNLRFIYFGNGDGGAGVTSGLTHDVSNIVGPGELICLTADVYNGANNTSAIIANNVYPYYCVNNTNVYNTGIRDSDGDSLSLSLVAALSTINGYNLSSQVIYKNPYNGQQPLSTFAGGFSFDSKTGDMTFTPDIIQRSLVTYKISEYRHGMAVGTSSREFIISTNACKDTCTVDTVINGTVIIRPNPTDDYLNIYMTNRPYQEFWVYDALGKQVLHQQILYWRTEINTTYWAAGTYYVMFWGVGGRKVERLVVRH